MDVNLPPNTWFVLRVCFHCTLVLWSSGRLVIYVLLLPHGTTPGSSDTTDKAGSAGDTVIAETGRYVLLTLLDINHKLDNYNGGMRHSIIFGCNHRFGLLISFVTTPAAPSILQRLLSFHIMSWRCPCFPPTPRVLSTLCKTKTSASLFVQSQSRALPQASLIYPVQLSLPTIHICWILACSET